MNVKHFLLLALSFVCLMSFSSFAQSNKDKSDELAESNTGVSFVSCASGGASIPSTLYVSDGKGGYNKLAVPSRRASLRIPFSNDGVYRFWTSNPAGGTLSTDKPAQRNRNANVMPDITLTLPSGLSGRMVCFLQARQGEGGALQVMGTCVPDQSFPKIGQTLLNLSPYTLVVTLASKPDFSDQQQIKIAPCANVREIESGNIYPFPGEAGARWNFILNAQLPGYEGLSRIRSSLILISKTQSQVMVVLKDPDKVGLVVELVQAKAPVTSTKRRNNSSRR